LADEEFCRKKTHQKKLNEFFFAKWSAHGEELKQQKDEEEKKMRLTHPQTP
jgi:hypothetical protein